MKEKWFSNAYQSYSSQSSAQSLIRSLVEDVQSLRRNISIVIFSHYNRHVNLLTDGLTKGASNSCIFSN